MTKNNITKEQEDRFWEKVDKKGPDDCWEWTACKSRKGHGQLTIGGVPMLAHRLSWLLHMGELPEIKSIRHKCRNVSCVNPAHLFIGASSLKEKMPQRFWSKVDKRGPDECWNWTAALDKDGYGVFCAHSKNTKAHRDSWILHNGPIPTGMCVLHSCDVPSCINPSHLFLGTNKDNTQDMMKKGRNRTTPVLGEANHSAKLTAKKVRALRYGFEEGYFDIADAARIFGVSKSTVHHIIKRRSWKHIT